MYVQRFQAGNEYTPPGEPILDTFCRSPAGLASVAAALRSFHSVCDIVKPSLFKMQASQLDRNRRDRKRIVSTASESRPEPEPYNFSQFAKVDSGFLAWRFQLLDGHGEEIASIGQVFRGFGREVCNLSMSVPCHVDFYRYLVLNPTSSDRSNVRVIFC